jgi:hypothetical protein
MEISGVVIQLLPLQSGQGKSGTWKKQEFILETPGQYPKKVCMNLWGDKVDEIKIAVGDKITASINVESREYNGRWYTDVRAWKVQKDGAQQRGDVPPPPDDIFMPDNTSSDDLPF